MRVNIFLPFLALFLLLPFITVTNGQQTWYWSMPRPQGNDLNTIDVVSPSTVYLGGDCGTFLKFSPLDHSWKVLNLPKNFKIEKIDFIDEDNGFAACSDSASFHLLKTTDGALNWTEVTPEKAKSLTFYAKNEAQLWMVIDSILYYSQDSGTNWQKVSSVPPFKQIRFYDLQNGWGIYRNKFYQTNDGGLSWDSVYVDQQNSSLLRLTKCIFVNKEIGYMIGTTSGPNHYAGYIFKTNNGGKSWIQQIEIGIDFVWYATFTDLAVLDSNTCWATTDYGKLYYTNDGGDTWKEINDVRWMTQIGIVDSARATLCGAGFFGVCYTSTDGGLNWQEEFEGFAVRLNDLFMVNSQIGFAVGENTLLKTTNGGKNWNKIDFHITGTKPKELTHIYFADSQTGWLSGQIGEDGYVYKTIDGGINWKVQLKIIPRIFDIFFLKDQKVVFIGARNKLYISSDLGNTWQLLYTFSDLDVESIYFLNADSGWVGGYLALAKTSDGGRSWEKVDPLNLGLYVKDVLFRDSKTGWIVGNKANSTYILRTDDFGKTWRIQYEMNGYSPDLRSVSFADNKVGYAVGFKNFSNIILKTEDGGGTWFKITAPTNNWLLKVQFVDPTHGWILGYGPTILSSFNVNTNIDEGTITTFPQDFYLEQNFPNPFNNTTKITYYLKKPEKISIILFDNLGRKVKLLDQGKKSSGWHVLTVSLKNLPSGIYYYRLVINGQVQTKKLLLLK